MTFDTGRALHGEPARYAGGLVDIAPGVCAWLQPNGDWSESNAGLIVGDGAAALIDTAWDLPLTQRIIDAVHDRTSTPITTLVATHGDGDHVNGFQLLPQATLIASANAADDMARERPAGLRRSRRGAQLLSAVALGSPRSFGTYIASMMDPFDFRGISLRTPDRVFDRELTVDVGGRAVQLRRLGPAHTSGDTIAHVPDCGVTFAGDLLFTGVTPNSWSGTVDRWRRALATILGYDPRVIVPGHGPLSTTRDVELLDRYWQWLARRARPMLERDSSSFRVARDIVFSDAFAAEPWGAWICPERTVLNVEIIRRERAGAFKPITHRERPGLMWHVARLHHELRTHRTP